MQGKSTVCKTERQGTKQCQKTIPDSKPGSQFMSSAPPAARSTYWPQEHLLAMSLISSSITRWNCLNSSSLSDAGI